MSNKTFAYIRTSTADGRQESSLAEQERKLRAAGATEIFVETKSGASIKQRPQLMAMLAKCRDGDRIVCTRVDRLSRSTADFLSIYELIEEKGATLSFTEQDIRTDTAAGKMLLQMLAVWSEFERSQIRERVQSGVDKARRDGKQLGRPKFDLETHSKAKALRTLVEQGTSIREAAATLGVAKSTAQRWLAA